MSGHQTKRQNRTLAIRRQRLTVRKAFIGINALTGIQYGGYACVPGERCPNGA